MSHFDAKLLDTDLEGMALLAAVLRPARAERKAEVPETGRRSGLRFGSFADTFLSPPAVGRPGRRSIKLA